MWKNLYQVKRSSIRMVLLSSESSSPSHQSRICFNLFFWICFSPDSQFVWFQGQPCANSTSLLPWLGFFGRKSFCWILLFSFSCQVTMIIYILYDKGRHKRKLFFFFGKLRKGGGISPNPKFPYQKKLRYFWNFFFQKGGGSHLFQKGVIRKTGNFLDILAKRGGLTQSIGILS